MFTERNEVARRAGLHAALADPGRLAIVDALVLGEASPSELQRVLDMPSNLLAHHVRVLERAGVVSRHRSEGDRRRSYLHLTPGSLDALRPSPTRESVREGVRVVFVCTENSARSPLATAIWATAAAVSTTSAGTHPAPAVHSGAVAAAARHRLPLTPTTPRHVDDVLRPDDMVITVCDAAHEELGAGPDRLHWSIPDPVRRGGFEAAFDDAIAELTDRIGRLAPAIRPTVPPAS
jgi:ArsR family transcriptional regulator, arsenate/arsenite/antimonite-responsive transcriptional repressor / arsenate reductase (thioredoxin)